MSIIVSVGIDKEDKEFLQQKGFSPTRVLRSAIAQLRDETPQMKAEYEGQIERLKNHSKRLVEFIQSRGLIDEFFQAPR